MSVSHYHHVEGTDDLVSYPSARVDCPECRNAAPVDNDERIHQDRMQQRYLTWYDGRLGGLFSIDTSSTLIQARENAALFIEDGYDARVMRVTVVDGQPVAEWVADDNDAPVARG